MKLQLHTSIILVILALFWQKGIAQFPQSLITKAELSDYRETSTHADVMEFVKYVRDNSDKVHVEIMFTSPEGRNVPLFILSNQGIVDPDIATKSGKTIVYIQGNIHGGEVEGKEAVMIAIRDILFGRKGHLLANQIILFCPVYNADGNDKFSPDNRRSQEGSPELAGERISGEGFDLNRDGMKMEAVETKGLMKYALLRWEPDLFVDLHTTNGTWHGNALTYAPNYEYAGHPATSEYLTDVMLPALQKIVLEKYDLHFDDYGGYTLREGWPPRNLYTYNHHPRYLVNQFGLRNKMAILSETFAHDPFYKRIHAAHSFIIEILEYTNRHGEEIRSINKKSEDKTIKMVVENAGRFSKGVRFTMVPAEKPLALRTYEYIPYTNDEGENSYVRSGNIIEVDGVNNYKSFETTLESTVPSGYVIPAEFARIVEKLKDHGIHVDTLKNTQTFSGETFMVESLDHAEREFEGHYMATLEGLFERDIKRFEPGDFRISMEQPLANLIFYLLEPQSDDGLATWNFFDEYLEEQGVGRRVVEYPVFKYW